MSRKILSLVAALLFPLTISAQTVEQLDPQNAPDVQVTEGLVDLDNANDGAVFVRGQGDDFKAPRSAEQRALRQEALKQKLAGKQVGKVHEVAKGQFVEMSLEKTDHIFVILVEYGDSKWSLTTPTINGPRHNQIAQPNRGTDNNTIWQADYSKSHFEDMYFNQMAAYYRTQSSGRYTVAGTVTDWVKVPFNGSRYGNNGMGDAGAWTLIADAINKWTENQLASGMTLDQIKAYLQQFDTWDRYDYNHNGNFNEPDGYIDHFQIVHAGNGEETGGGALGSDAIWSHRWQAWYNFGGYTGPSFNLDGGVEFGGGWGANPNGGTVGSSGAAVLGFTTLNANAATVMNAYPVHHTGIWVGDYTVQPENGGLGVFAHEYGHDLGLPDHYDTAGGTNGTGFWTIMSSGSYLGNGQTDIGSRPGDFSAWDKFQLGWLNYEVADPSKLNSFKLGPAETNTKQAQAVIVPLDPAINTFFTYDPVNKMKSGVNAYWGGRANNFDASMVRQIAVPTTGAALKMQLSYDIENNYDFAYVSVSTNNGTTWTNLLGTYTNASGTQTKLSTRTDFGITGSSANAWRASTFDMTPYAGQTVLVRIRYVTDPYTVGKGLLVDDISIGSFTDNVETDGGWTLTGFKVTNGVESSNAPHFYFAEFRQYRTYDAGLQTGPYLFGTLSMPKWVSHYPYQDGLLVAYWDTDQSNNNTSTHRGEGLILPIDAHPDPLSIPVTPDGVTSPLTLTFNSAIQVFDATFGLDPTDALSFPVAYSFGGKSYQVSASFPSQAGNPLFNDLNPYWNSRTGASSVITPKTGTTIRVVSTSAQDSFMQIQVAPGN